MRRGRTVGAVALILAVASVAIYIAWQRALRPWVAASPPERLAAVGAGVWAVTVALLYVWRRVSLRHARSKADGLMATVLADVQRQFDALLSQTVGLAAVTLEWAVRAEMVRDDLEDVQEYMQQVAKRPGVRRALVASKDGQVIASSEPANRGQSLSHTVSDPLPESSEAQILPRPGGSLRLIIPIMGLESRLGTLLVDYERPILAATVTRS